MPSLEQAGGADLNLACYGMVYILGSFSLLPRRDPAPGSPEAVETPRTTSEGTAAGIIQKATYKGDGVASAHAEGFCEKVW